MDNKEESQLQQLPLNLITDISCFLDLQDFVNLCYTNKQYYEKLYKNYHCFTWKQLNQSYYFKHQKVESQENQENPFEFFKIQYKKLQRIKKIWQKQMKALNIDFKQYEETLADKSKRIKNMLDKFFGLNDSENLKIPIDLMLFYFPYDISNIQLNNADKAMMGGMSFYEFKALLYFFTDSLNEENGNEFHVIGKVGYQKELCIDVKNVFQQGKENFCVWMNMAPTIKMIHIFENGIMNFMERYNNYELRDHDQEESYLDIIDSKYKPCSDKTTQGIRVRATVKFIPGLNKQLNHFFYSYQIRISDNGLEEGVEYQLESRKWIIKQEDGDESVTEGPGVIGLYPRVSKGCEDFVYESCCPLECMTGSMKGHFIFKNSKDNTKIQVEIGEFQLKPKPHERLVMYDTEKKEAHVIYPVQN